MDRNPRSADNRNIQTKVALRKESVDRNICACYTIDNKRKVALRKESVDRNLMTSGDVTAPSASLSARRAWIEILLGIA